MTSTISQHNKKSGFSTVFLWTLRRNMTITLVYSVLLFVSFPLELFWTASSLFAYETKIDTNILNDFVKYYYPFTSLSVCLFALIIAGLTFNYLHKKRSVDLYNAFPLSRKDMYFSKYLAGLFIVTVPVIAIAIIAAVPAAILGVDVVHYILPNLLLILFSGAATYSFTVFLCTCSGKTIDAIILSIGLSTSFPLAIIISNALFTSWVPGFSGLFEIPLMTYLLLTPESICIASVFGYNLYDGLSAKLIIYLLYFLLFTALSVTSGYYTYKKRRMECAQTEFSFKLPAHIIRFIITYTVGIVLSSFFTLISTMGGSAVLGHLWFWVGILCGSFAAHIVLEAILSKGLKQLKKSMLLYLIVIAFTGAIYIFSITGFAGSYAKIPNADDVKSVSIDAYVPAINSGYYDMSYVLFSGDAYKVTVEDKEYIKEVISVHDDIVSGVKENYSIPFGPDSNDSYSDGSYTEYDDSLDKLGLYGFNITYTLNNGSKINRRYNNENIFNYDIYKKVENIIYNRKFIEANIYKAINSIENLNDDYSSKIALNFSSYEYGDRDKALYFNINNKKITKEQSIAILKELIKEMSSDKKLQDLINVAYYYDDSYYNIHIGVESFYCSIDLPSSFTDTVRYIFSNYS